MKPLVVTITVLGIALMTAGTAEAACYADYKAKKGPPLQLHYGVVKVPDKFCRNRKGVRRAVQKRISVGGWKLLNVISVFGPEGLAGKQGNAGRFFLKY